MSQSFQPAVNAPSNATPVWQRDLCTRIQAEFREMPGLTLTLAQASRLFDIDPERCERVLAALVDAGQLVTDGKTFAGRRRGRRSA